MVQITDETIAQNKVERFVSRFELSYHGLACHAALPLVLTPELVNYLRVQFLKSEGVPWIAEADLLLSDLCRPVGYELYVMDEAVRVYLLHKLEQDKKFGETRIKEIAHLLLSYVKHLAKTNPFLCIKELETQKWGAMLYVNTEQTVKEIARAISECVDKAELARLLKITEDFKKQIAKSEQFQEFWDYAQVSNDLLRNPQEVSSELISQPYQIADLKLAVPEILLQNSVSPGLKTCTFEVATIDIEETRTFEFTVATIERQRSRAKRKQEQWAIKHQKQQAEGIIELLAEGIELELMEIPAGTFWMGTEDREIERLVKKFNWEYFRREKHQHEVTIAPFYLGRYPITQGQWKAIAERSDLQVQIDLNPDPSRFKEPYEEYERWTRPVEQVNWYEAKEFCARLSQLTGKQYRLPTEAEWEYVCRAGTTTPFHFGETLTGELANYDATKVYADEPKGIYREETTPVGYFQVANTFGLYDLHGNVYEWCEDDYHPDYEGAPTDGSAWVSDDGSTTKILRGGAWIGNPDNCRSAFRYYSLPRDVRLNYIGFRVVRSSPRTP